MASVVLVRYGRIPEVSRFRPDGNPDEMSRGETVVVQTHRGLQLGTVLDTVRMPTPDQIVDPPKGQELTASSPGDGLPPIVRRANSEDLETEDRLRQEAREAFDVWRARIEQWQLELELIDLEWTIDRGKLILYVLNTRGPDCTKLALQAAAAGFGIIEVQPVSADGLVTVPTSPLGGGCGTCGCN